MSWRLRAITVLLVLCVVGLGLLVYQLVQPEHETNGPTTAQTQAPSLASLGHFTPLAAPRPAPAVSFAARSGEAVSLADFRGRVVLVNLWATWCAPCVREMPSLERLQTKFRRELTILAISEDRRGAELVDPFIRGLGLKHLATYLDPKSSVGHAFGVIGLPTSFLIDRDGRILGRLEGAAEWDSDEMVTTLRRYIAQPAPLQKVSTQP